MELTKERKTLLLSVMIVGIALTMLGAGTLAYFSSTQSVANSFTAGTIVLSVNGSDTWSQAFNASLSDLKPCMRGWGNVTLSNTGTNPMDVWVKVDVIDTSNGTATYPEILDTPASEAIDGVILYDLFTNNTAIIEESDGYTLGTPSRQMIGNAAGTVDGSYIWLTNLVPGAAYCVNQSFNMTCNTTNWAQGDIVNFAVTFYGQQSEPATSPPPAPTPELSGFERP